MFLFQKNAYFSDNLYSIIANVCSGLLFLLPAYYALLINQKIISCILFTLTATSVTHIIIKVRWLRLIDYVLVILSILSGVWLLFTSHFPYPGSLYAVLCTVVSLISYGCYRSVSSPMRKDVLYIMWHICATSMALVTLWASTQ